jgi:hypothetical protein
MWIVTDKGFFSFVVDRKDPTMLWLRARVREDLARNFPDAEIVEKPGSDYVFRAKVSKADVAARMSQMIMEADITGHFKDVAKARSAKPTHGDRGSAYYAFWTAMAKLQPYAPYSKTPRDEERKYTPAKTWHPGDRTVSASQNDLFSGSESRGLYGGPGAGYRASDFDWDNKSWGGKSTPDPALPKPSQGKRLTEAELTELIEHGDTDALLDVLHTLPGDSPAFDLVWSALTPEEAERFLDEEEARFRALEEMGAEVSGEVEVIEVEDVLPNPVNRPGTRRQRRKAERKARKNRHNQHQHGGYSMTNEQYAVYAQERRDGKHGKQQQDRQAFIDKQKAEKHKGAWN